MIKKRYSIFLNTTTFLCHPWCEQNTKPVIKQYYKIFSYESLKFVDNNVQGSLKDRKTNILNSTWKFFPGHGLIIFFIPTHKKLWIRTKCWFIISRPSRASAGGGALALQPPLAVFPGGFMGKGLQEHLQY